MRSDFIKKLVLSGVMMALVCILTLVHFTVSAGGAYIHPGDSMIAVAGYVLGIWAVPVAALGSALADLMVGGGIYVPATLIVKGLMGVAAAMLNQKRGRWGMTLGVLVLMEAIMLAGYGIFEWVMFGAAAALTGLLFNLIQMLGSIFIAMGLLGVVKKIPNL